MLPVEAMSISEAASDDLLKVETPSTWDYGHSSNYVNIPALGCQPPRARNNFSIPATEDCEDSGKISKSISSTKIVPLDVFKYYPPLYSVIPSTEDGDSSLKDSGRGDFSFLETEHCLINSIDEGSKVVDIDEGSSTEELESRPTHGRTGSCDFIISSTENWEEDCSVNQESTKPKSTLEFIEESMALAPKQQ